MAPFAPEDLNRLWQPGRRSAFAASTPDPIGALRDANGHPRWSTAELLRLFTSTYLAEDILHKVDRASMYVALEVRAPFLSRAFAEAAMDLPSQMKIDGLETKSILKTLARRHIPSDIVDRKKHGFA